VAQDGGRFIFSDMVLKIQRNWARREIVSDQFLDCRPPTASPLPIPLAAFLQTLASGPEAATD